MKILELLLPKGVNNRDLSPKAAARIDMLQDRMNRYVDKISDPSTPKSGKDFLKTKLKQDYEELKTALESKVNEAEGTPEGVPHLNKELLTHIVQQIGTEGANAIVKSLQWGDGAATELLQLIKQDLKKHIDIKESVKQRLDKSCWSGYKKAGTKTKGGVRVNNCVPKESAELQPVEPIQLTSQYEIIDSKTGKVVGKPYASRSRASARRDRLDNDYGAYRYKVRKVGNDFVTEAVNKVPLSDNDFELVKQLMSHPIPAIVAPIYIQEILDDDEFTDMLQEWSETAPGMDVRPHIVEWFKRVMPDQMHRFTNDNWTLKQRMGTQSIIHGYDPQDYHSSGESV